MPDHLKVPLGPFTDRYVVRGPIAEGGSATVYLADDLERQRQVALKVATVAEWDQRRWQQEWRNMDRLRRMELPCVLVADDAGQHNRGLAYFVMPLCLGGSLQDRVRQSGAISPAAALAILKWSAPGLDQVHAAGLVHRDLKPANIMFAEADRALWRALLSDWGIAQYVGDESLTTSHVIGSARYMSPQRKAGAPATAADDQYGLGKTIEDALRGYGFGGRGDTQIPPQPAALAAVLRRAQHPEPARRYQTLSAMLTDFHRAVRSLDEATAQNPLPGTEESATAPTNEQTRTRVAAHGMPGSGEDSDSEAQRARRAVRDRVGAGRVGQLEDQLQRVRAAQAKAERERDDARARVKAERNERKQAKHQYAAERTEMRRRLAQAERAVAAAQQERALVEQRLAHALEALAASQQATASAMRMAESAVAGMAGGRAGAEDVAQEERFAQAVGGGFDTPRPKASLRPPRGTDAPGVASFADYAKRRGSRPHTDSAAQPRGPHLSSVPRATREQMATAAQQATRTAHRLATTGAALCLGVTAVASLAALWGTFDHRLPASVTGHVLLGHSLTVASTTIAIYALAAAAFCRTLMSVLSGDGRGLAAWVCLAAGIAALWVGHVADQHHTSPQWLAPGQWYLLGILLLLLSLLTPAHQVGRVSREMALGAGLAVALTAAIPQGTMVRGLLVLAAVLVVTSVARYVSRSLIRPATDSSAGGSGGSG